MPAIRPFALADVLLVRQLQRNDASLAIEHVLTHPRSPLWLALTAPWPWAGMGVATYVLRGRGKGASMRGFAQLLKRTARPEADLLHLAPARLDPDVDTFACGLIWRQLLAHCSLEAAQRGIERIFASVPDGGPEQTWLSEAGFRPYTQETIYRLSVPPDLSPAPAGFRSQRPADSWALQRLYVRSTPLLVQQAEGAVAGGVGAPRLSWWEPERWHGAVWAPAGEVRGAVQVHLGRSGDWLRIWGGNLLTAREARGLVEHGLRLIAAHRQGDHHIPAYSTVRSYHLGLSGALAGFGFIPCMERTRFVKHTTAACHQRLAAPVRRVEVLDKVPLRSQAPMDQNIA